MRRAGACIEWVIEAAWVSQVGLLFLAMSSWASTSLHFAKPHFIQLYTGVDPYLTA